MKIFIIILIIGIALWTAWSYYASQAIQLGYKVIEKKEKYEIRQYDPYIAMQVEVVGNDKEDALNAGFRILANYIFGGNISNNSIAMTAPVMSKKNESIAMTAPVLEKKSGEKTIVTFTAPPQYTLETLPKPIDENIKFTQIESKKIAAYKFSWYYSQKRIEKMKKEFLEILNQEGQTIKGEPSFAGYNGPGTIPFMVRNEILVEIE